MNPLKVPKTKIKVVMDNLTGYPHVFKMDRSENMSRIKGKNTKPEMVVRRLLWNAGYRYRLHSKDLPGKPDVVFRSRKKVVFVHGCFWHRHQNCKYSTTPKTNRSFWQKKFEANILRDQKVQKLIGEAGYESLVIWECEIKNLELLKQKLISFVEKI